MCRLYVSQISFIYVMALIRAVLCPSTANKSSVVSSVDECECLKKDDKIISGKMGRADDSQTSDKVVIEVGGDRFVTRRSTLLNVPQTLLCNLVSDSSPAGKRSEFFFDRNPFLFGYILDFYRTGELHLPQNRCGRAIQSELDFWGLDEGCVATCCWKTFTDATQTVRTQMKITEEFRSQPKPLTIPDSFRCRNKERLWRFLSDPCSSAKAKVYSTVSSLLVLLSLVMTMLATMPEARVKLEHQQGNESETNHTRAPYRHVLRMLTTTTPHAAIMYADFALALLFSAEFLVKLFVCPDKRDFVKSFPTFCDLVYVLPVLVVRATIATETYPTEPRFTMLVHSLFALRVLRLFRLASCFRSFKVVVLSLRASLRELFLLIALLVFTALFFAFVIFYVEIWAQDSFSNALMGMWWAVITMTSVGYGDLYPTSALGYVVGVLCAFAGIVLISLPVPMVANNFNLYYAYREKVVVTTSHSAQWRGEPATDVIEPGVRDEIERDDDVKS